MRSFRTFFFEVQSTFEVILSSIHNFETCYSELLVLGLPEETHWFPSANRGQVRCDYVPPVLKSLHWLPVESRIALKTLVLTFKTRERISPKYLQDLITDHDFVPSRNLRFALKYLLKVSDYNL